MSVATTNAPAYESLIGRAVRLTGLPPWLAAIAALALVEGAVLVAITLDGRWSEAHGWVFWRARTLNATVLAYIILIYPVLVSLREKAADSLEALAEDRQAFAASRAGTEPNRRLWELASIGLWVAIGFWSDEPWSDYPGQAWQTAWDYPATVLMWGAAGAVIYQAVSGTLDISRLFRQRLRIDLFAEGAFSAVTRWSLFVSSATLLGAAVAVLFVDPVDLAEPRVYSVFITFILISVGLFFANLRTVNRALAAERQADLTEIRKRVSAAAAALKRSMSRDGEAEARRELADWVLYERRLREVSVWPINVGTMARLAGSAAVPGVTYLAKLLFNAVN
jgi:hypothetical protein